MILVHDNNYIMRYLFKRGRLERKNFKKRVIFNDLDW